MSALFSFLGGSAFRMIWGELSAIIRNRQDFKRELAMLQLQGQLDAAQHERNLAAIRVQADLGVKTIQVQADADIRQTDAEAFRAAMERASTPTGVRWVDAWNGCVRPATATIALFLWLLSEHRNDWALSVFTLELIGVALGFYFADRTLGKRGR